MAEIGSFRKNWEPYLPWRDPNVVLHQWLTYALAYEAAGHESWCPLPDESIIESDPEPELEIEFNIDPNWARTLSKKLERRGVVNSLRDAIRALRSRGKPT